MILQATANVFGTAYAGASFRFWRQSTQMPVMLTHDLRPMCEGRRRCEQDDEEEPQGEPGAHLGGTVVCTFYHAES
jgi:hypothetical protein